MPKSLDSPRQKALAKLLTAERRRAGLSQEEVADKLGRYQSFVAHYESGQRRIDVVELLEIAEAIGFDPVKLVKKLKAAK